MRVFRGLTIACTIGMTTIIGCGSGSNDGAKHEGTSVGSVGLSLQVVAGVTINTLSYSITGNSVSRTGTIDITNPGSQYMLLGLPAASGYTIALTATSTDGSVGCNGSAPFTVAPTATTLLTVPLECTDAAGGPVGVAATLNMCPRIQSISADPSPTSSTFTLASTALDRDNGPSPLSFAWSATDGTFSNAAIANPVFTCSTNGAATLTLNVFDGQCTASTSINVSCAGVTTAFAFSRKPPSCLACAQANACLTPSCESITGNAAAGPAAGTPKSQLCTDVLSCIFATSCATGAAISQCYCGTASGTACLAAGSANGACKSQEEKGLELTDPTGIATGFGDQTRGGGVANEIVQCLQDSGCTTCF